jgi:type IV pilus assembly protein PilA
MLNHYRSIKRQDRKGFTLIELMVVLLIMAILLAIAIPIFLGVTGSANNRAAQSNLNTALVNAKAAYQSNSQSYIGVSAATLGTNEPSINFVTTASTSQSVVSVFVTADGNAVVLAALSKTGSCFYAVDEPMVTATTFPFGTGTANGMETNGTAIVFSNAAPGTIYAEAKVSTAAQCIASAPLSGAGSYAWSTSGFPNL